MGSKKRTIEKVWKILLFGLIPLILFDPVSSIRDFSENVEARVGLPAARAKWDAQGITHYKFDVTMSTAHLCIWGANLEVKDGKVIKVGKISDPRYPPDTLPSPRKLSSDVYPLCDYRNFSMPTLFDEVERSLQSVSRISFDRRYGFISSVRFGSPGGRALLSRKVWDCCGGFGIFNFQVLEK